MIVIADILLLEVIIVVTVASVITVIVMLIERYSSINVVEVIIE